MEKLQRYPISLILSFLSERDAIALMLTRKKYTHELLPVFRRKRRPDDDNDECCGLRMVGSTSASRQQRYVYRFAEVPVQDPTVLLARLNTRRLFARKCLPPKHFTTDELAEQEWNEQQNRGEPAHPCTRELCRFETASPACPSFATLLVSYPRSGNTLLRTLLEKVTGLVTGSDTRPDRHLSRQLAEQHDLVGEGVTLLSMVKSHWPERAGCQVVAAQRVILLVRNPYDAMDSYWNMNATKSHTRTVTDTVYARFDDFYADLARNEIRVWHDYIKFWLHPDRRQYVCVLRLEELIANPARALEKVLCFHLGMPELSPFWNMRIRHCTSGQQLERLGSYRPRSGRGGGGVGKSLHRYSDVLLTYVQDYCAAQPINYLRVFGYGLDQGFPDNFRDATVAAPPELPGWLRLQRVPQHHNRANVRINANVNELVRPLSCRFGRALQAWRHSVTDNDKDPLPTTTTAA